MNDPIMLPLPMKYGRKCNVIVEAVNRKTRSARERSIRIFDDGGEDEATHTTFERGEFMVLSWIVL